MHTPYYYAYATNNCTPKLEKLGKCYGQKNTKDTQKAITAAPKPEPAKHSDNPAPNVCAPAYTIQDYIPFIPVGNACHAIARDSHPGNVPGVPDIGKGVVDTGNRIGGGLETVNKEISTGFDNLGHFLTDAFRNPNFQNPIMLPMIIVGGVIVLTMVFK